MKEKITEISPKFMATLMTLAAIGSLGSALALWFLVGWLMRVLPCVMEKL